MARMKSPTPQELYRAKKQREQQEKQAYLPPGLINHGNTCFMNSVLQGLIATRLLSDLAHSNLESPSSQQHSTTTALSSRRSPLLTNGHRLGGEFEQGWVDSMPIGDVFLDTMLKAWNSQDRKARESLSPKLLLSVLGRKYEQYLDFAQQDAHEFLRILLDATRMEELDVIKKRQPPPETVKKRRRTTITPSYVGSTTSEPLSQVSDDKLMSLSDMIFGGKLTSILVCQKCKHISQTYEDFNDISLSIKAEDYQERKRDRLKNLAKRLTSFPTSSSLSVTSEPPRSSSVPPSPREAQFGGNDEPQIAVDTRHRSVDVLVDTAQDADSEPSTTTSKEYVAMTESDGSSVLINGVALNGVKHVEIATSMKPEKKERKEKKGDNWTKISRRISMTVGLGKVSNKERRSRSRDRTSQDLAQQVAHALSPQSSEYSTHTDPPSSTKSTPRTSTAAASSSGLSSTSTQLNGPDPIVQPRSPSPASSHHYPYIQPGKSPKPPKPTVGELNYLREILADITPASSSNPFALFKSPHYHYQNSSNRSVSGSTAATSAQNLWLNMNHFSGIEECLRMFTSVEILDGENMVGCRRCWKIAHGVYQKPSADHEGHGDDDSDSVDQGSLDSLPTIIPHIIAQPRPTLSPLSPPQLGNIPTSMSTPTVSFYSEPDSTGNCSVSSLPAEPSPLPDSQDPFTLTLPLENLSTPGGLPIPFISTTGPDSPTFQVHPPHLDPIPPVPVDRSVSSASHDADATPTAQHVPRLGQVLSHFPPPLPPKDSNSKSNSSTTDSLPLPLLKTRRQQLHHKPDLDADDSSGGESEASIATSAHSLSSAASVSAPSAPSRYPKPKLPKQVIMRPAYKRYLIGVPPPVLVIHLKRFQHTSQTHLQHMLSFSHGFRKLDDYVTFPEMLDLTPYLAPRKEDFGLGRRGRGGLGEEGKEGHGDGKGKGKRKQKEKCMYRLYAVVVHIGNMLGGHYVAYTALPDSRSPEDTAASTEKHTHAHDRKPAPQRQWAYISDTVVRLTTLEEVLKAKAYICMYERI